MKNEAAMKDYIDKWTGEGSIPGTQYIVLDPNRIIFEYAGGLADIRDQEPMKTGTTMMAYSMTKTITAAAILQLVEKGEVGLDDSIDLHLTCNPYGKTITICHLLSQTSGIPNPIPLRWVHLAEKHEEFDEDAALARILKKYPGLSFEPGKRYAYSNISYWLLGKIIEKASGLSYQAYIREHIIAPLQLSEKEMNFIIPDPANHAKGYLARYSLMNLLKGFLIDKELFGNYEGNWLHIKDHYLNGAAFGGLIGSACSFGKFLQDQLKEKSVLFDKETRDLYYTRQKNNAGELVEMTLGWHIGYLEGKKFFFKEGGGGGYHCEMRIYQEERIASIMMINETSAKCRKYLNTLDKAILSSPSSPCS